MAALGRRLAAVGLDGRCAARVFRADGHSVYCTARRADAGILCATHDARTGSQPRLPPVLLVPGGVIAEEEMFFAERRATLVTPDGHRLQSTPATALKRYRCAYQVRPGVCCDNYVTIGPACPTHLLLGWRLLVDLQAPAGLGVYCVDVHRRAAVVFPENACIMTLRHDGVTYAERAPLARYNCCDYVAPYAHSVALDDGSLVILDTVFHRGALGLANTSDRERCNAEFVAPADGSVDTLMTATRPILNGTALNVSYDTTGEFLRGLQTGDVLRVRLAPAPPAALATLASLYDWEPDEPLPPAAATHGGFYPLELSAHPMLDGILRHFGQDTVAPARTMARWAAAGSTGTSTDWRALCQPWLARVVRAACAERQLGVVQHVADVLARGDIGPVFAFMLRQAAWPDHQFPVSQPQTAFFTDPAGVAGGVSGACIPQSIVVIGLVLLYNLPYMTGQADFIALHRELAAHRGADAAAQPGPPEAVPLDRLLGVSHQRIHMLTVVLQAMVGAAGAADAMDTMDTADLLVTGEPWTAEQGVVAAAVAGAVGAVGTAGFVGSTGAPQHVRDAAAAYESIGELPHVFRDPLTGEPVSGLSTVPASAIVANVPRLLLDVVRTNLRDPPAYENAAYRYAQRTARAAAEPSATSYNPALSALHRAGFRALLVTLSDALWWVATQPSGTESAEMMAARLLEDEALQAREVGRIEHLLRLETAVHYTMQHTMVRPL